jgi:SAM-dependent methyltransferase
MSAADPYAPQAYWDELLETRLDERGVGYPGLALALNRAMYDAERDQLARLLDDRDISIGPSSRVLDIGAGSGIWIEFWERRGAGAITGVDLTEAAVDGLRRRFPRHEFAQVDIGQAHGALAGPFDVISAMSVLLHITDEQRWRSALQTIAGLLAPGGHAVLIEPLVVHRWWGPPFGPEANSKARPLEDWRAALADAGLELVELRPATVLLGNVVDTRRRWAFQALSWYWRALGLGIGPRERPGRVAAVVLSAIDRPLRRRLPAGPTAKLLLLRRR